MPETRLVRPDEEPLVLSLLRGAYGGGTGGTFFRWLVRTQTGPVVLVEDRGTAVAIGGGVALGRAGWIGGIGTLPEARRRGHGSLVTAAVMDELERRGCETILLLATELGRPLYERLGFEAECDYVVAGGPLESLPAPTLRAGDLERAAALDRWATGSDRSFLLAQATGGLVEEDGYGLITPWRDRPVVARDAETGMRLLDALHPVRLTVPEANDAALEWAAQNGYTISIRAPRMRVGPPLDWRPETLFGAISLLSA